MKDNSFILRYASNVLDENMNENICQYLMPGHNLLITSLTPQTVTIIFFREKWTNPAIGLYLWLNRK